MPTKYKPNPSSSFTDVRDVTYNNEDVNQVTLDNVIVWSRDFTITFTGTYCTWANASKVGYYGDKILASDNTVTCYVGTSNTVRWSNTVTKYSDTVQYNYTNLTIGSIISPISGNAIISATATQNVSAYKLSGIYENGSVTWYSDSGYATVIPANTAVAFGTTVYYKYNPNTGYSGSGQGSFVLNTTNFTFSGDTASHSFGSATRIKWTATVTMGTGVAKYRYTTDGTNWSSETTTNSIPNIDYAATLTVKATTASEGYTVTTNTATATYSSQSVTVPAATRIKWSLAVTQNNYIASWTYKINGGTAVSKTSSYTIENLDYSDSVVISATRQSEAAWDYGSIIGAGTFTYSSAHSTTLACTRSRKQYTITFAGTYCTWEQASLTAEYGDTLTQSGTTVTCKKWSDSTNRWQNSASAFATTAQYSYGTPVVATVTSPITANQTVSASSTRTLRSYTISFTNPTYGSWANTSKTAYYGDVLTVNSYTVTCTGTANWTNTCSALAATDQWSYSLTGSVSVTSPVSGAQSVTGPSSKRDERTYNVVFNDGTYGAWDNKTTITATYSTQITKNGLAITVGDTTRTYSLPANTAQYTYTGSISGTFPTTVGTGKTYTPTTSQTVNAYAISITAGSGISSVYLSTSNTATSGSPSGTSYNYGTTVYAFAVLGEHYDIPSGSSWALVAGEPNETGSKYRVSSVSVTGTHNFGTINAAIEKYTLTITKNTGISTIYYKVNGASSYTSSTSTVSVSVNDLSTYYYYATADSYHTVNSDCGSSSSPKSGTVNCADISKSVTTTAKSYKLVGTYTNGWVKWYSDSARTTEITAAGYGSTVYYAYGANAGYAGNGTGSLVLNTTNFVFDSTEANSNATHNFGAATRLTWNLSITKAGYTNSVTYKKNSESAVSVNGTVNLTGLDYADTVVVAGTAQSESMYTYSTVTGTGTFSYSPSNQSTTVTCSRTWKSYTFTLTKNSNVASIKIWRTGNNWQDSSHSDYPGSTSSSSSPMINGSGTAVIYYGDILAGSATASTGYHFGSSNSTTTDSYSNSNVTGAASWSPTVNLNAYTASFSGTNCSWGSASQTIYHFDYISTSGQTVTCKAGGSFGSTRWTNTATKNTETGYTFGTPSLSGNTSVSSVTGNISISASSTKSRTAFTVSFATTTYGSWSEGSSLAAYYGDKITRSGNTVTCYKWDATSTERWHNILSAQTTDAQYTYWATASGDSITSLTSNASFGATSGRDERHYSITFSNGTYGSWDSTDTISALYSAQITISGTTLTVKEGSTTLATRTYTNSATGYTCTSTIKVGNSTTSPQTVGTGKAVTVDTTKTANQYTLTIHRKYYPITGAQTYNTTATSETDDSITVTYNQSYTYTYSKTNYISQTTSGTWTTAGNGSTTLTLVPTQYNITQTDIAHANESLSHSWVYAGSWTVTQTVNPDMGYDYTTGGTRYYHGSAYTRTITAPATASFGNLTMNKFNYTVSGGTSNNGSVAWSGSSTTLGDTATWTITANDYYYRPTTYTGTKTINNTNFTLNEANKTATYSGNLGNCSPYSYTIQEYGIVGGNVYWSTSQITTSGGSATLTAAYGTTVYWRVAANTGYNLPSTYYGSTTLNASNFTISSKTSNGNATYKGSISNCSVKSYTLTISTTGSTYGTAGVSRTSSPLAGAATGALSNGATIYYGDKLSCSASAAATTYGSWDYSESQFKVATGSWNGGATTSPSITLTAQNSAPAYLYVWRNDTWTNLVGSENWSNQSGKTNTYIDTGLAFNTTYTYHVAGYKHRNYWTHSVVDAGTLSANYSSTNGVTGNVTATFEFSESSAQTESSWTSASPSTVEIATGSQTTCTITWRYLTAYPDTWTEVQETYSYGQTPSRAAASTVTSGNYRKVFSQWDSLAIVTANRTITAQYTTQYYITCNGTRCSSSSSRWAANGDTFTASWTADTNCAFNSDGTQTTATQSITVGTAPATYSKSADYIYVTVNAQANTTKNKSTDWHHYGDTRCTYAANSGYAFDSSGTTTKYSSYFTSPGGTYSCPSAITHAYLTVSAGTGCSATGDTTSSGWKSLGTYYTTFTANSGYAFDSSGTASKRVSVAVPGTNTASCTHGYYTLALTNCTRSSGEAAGWKALGSTYTTNVTANSGYAFNSSGTTTSSCSSGVPGTASANPGYGYYSLSLTNCSRSSGSAAGWYTAGSTQTTNVTASSGYAFNSSGTTTSSCSATVPGTGSASPSYGYLTVSVTHCSCTDIKASQGSGSSTGTTGSGWLALSGNKYRVYFSASSNYAFDSSGTTSSYVDITIPNTATGNPSYGYYGLSLTHCTRSSGSAAGWYTVGTTQTTNVTASSNYAFNSSGTTTSSCSATVPGTASASPGYGYYSLSLTRCSRSSGETEGWKAIGSTYTTYVSANTNYAFDSSGTTSSSCSSAVPGTASKSADYGYYGLSLTNCSRSSGSAAGWYGVGTTQTTNITASSNYAFDSSGTTTSSCSATVPGTGSASPSYAYLTVPSSGTNCTATSGTTASGWKTLGSYTANYTANSNYAFDSGGTTTKDSASVSVPGTITPPTITHAYLTVPASGTNCTKTSGSTSSGWKALGSYTANYTANSNYAFNSSGATTKDSASVSVPGTIVPPTVTHAYLTVPTSGTNCTATSGTTSSGWKTLGSYTANYTANSGYAFNSSGSTTKDSASVSVPGTITPPTITHGKLTVSATNCTADYSTSWQELGNYTVTFTANTGWSFGGSVEQDTSSVGPYSLPHTFSGSPSYFYLTIGGSNNASITKNGTIAEVSSGWYTSSTKPSSITWYPATYYSYNSGTTQTTKTVSSIPSSPATYSYSPGYVAAASISSGDTYCDKTSNHVANYYYAIGTDVTYDMKVEYSYYNRRAYDIDRIGTVRTAHTITITAGKNVVPMLPRYWKIHQINTIRCVEAVAWQFRSDYWYSGVSNPTYSQAVEFDWSFNANYDDGTQNGSDGTTAPTPTTDNCYCFGMLTKNFLSIPLITARLRSGYMVFTDDLLGLEYINQMFDDATGDLNVTATHLIFDPIMTHVDSYTNLARFTGKTPRAYDRYIGKIGDTVSLTAASGYAYDNIGTGTSTGTVPSTQIAITVIGGIERRIKFPPNWSAEYANVTGYSGTRCSATSGTGWLTDTSWTASSHYAFSGSSTTTSKAAVAGTNTNSADYIDYPQSGAYSSRTSPSYRYLHLGTNYNIEWTSTSEYAGWYNSDLDTIVNTKTFSVTILDQLFVGEPVDRIYTTVTAANSKASCSGYFSDQTSWSGWVPYNGTISWTANSGWSFGGPTAGTQDTTSTNATIANGSLAASPGYCLITISTSHCKAECSPYFANKTSGTAIVNNGATINWTADSGYTLDGASTSTVNGPGIYSNTASNGITIAKRRIGIAIIYRTDPDDAGSTINHTYVPNTAGWNDIYTLSPTAADSLWNITPYVVNSTAASEHPQVGTIWNLSIYNDSTNGYKVFLGSSGAPGAGAFDQYAFSFAGQQNYNVMQVKGASYDIYGIDSSGGQHALKSGYVRLSGSSSNASFTWPSSWSSANYPGGVYIDVRVDGEAKYMPMSINNSEYDNFDYINSTGWNVSIGGNYGQYPYITSVPAYALIFKGYTSGDYGYMIADPITDEFFFVNLGWYPYHLEAGDMIAGYEEVTATNYDMDTVKPLGYYMDSNDDTGPAYNETLFVYPWD